MGNIGFDVRFIAESDAFLFDVDYVSLQQKHGALGACVIPVHSTLSICVLNFESLMTK